MLWPFFQNCLKIASDNYNSTVIVCRLPYLRFTEQVFLILQANNNRVLHLWACYYCNSVRNYIMFVKALNKNIIYVPICVTEQKMVVM